MARVFTPHPIQDRTDDEMRAYADAAYDEIVAAITRLTETRASADRLGDGEGAAGVGDVEVLDHPAVDGDDAAPVGLGLRRRRR